MKTEYAAITLIVAVGVVLAAATILQTHNRQNTTETSITIYSLPQTTTTSAEATTTSKAKTTSSTTSATTTSYAAVADPQAEMTVSADKAVYHSGNVLNLSVSMNSAQRLPGAQLKVYGIMSGRYRIDAMEKVDIEAGASSFSLSYTTPRCYVCGGITPGRYNLTADLIYGGKVIASSTTEFEMQQ
jgi:hypothetical protein